MTGFQRWLRTTFDYNPTFPLSALLLLAGLRVLSVDGELDAASVADTALGVGILQAYELGLVAVALLLLWPRRIAYETTSILTIVGVVRFASLFLAAGMAAEGRPLEACLFGGALALLMVAKGEAVVRGVGLDLRRWERAYDYGLYGLAAVGFPLLGNRLAAWTGAELSYAEARLLHTGAWWGFALLLVPATRGLAGLGPSAPLRSRRPAIVWRCLTAAGLGLLLHNALWVGGETPPLLAYLPLSLVALALYAAIVRVDGDEVAPWLTYAPAALTALLLLAPQRLILGAPGVCSRPLAILAFLPLAAASLWLLSPHRLRPGLRALALLAALAPIRLAPTWTLAGYYVLAVSLTLVALGVSRRRDRLVLAGSLLSLGVTVLLTWSARSGPAPSEWALVAAGALALLLAPRRLDGSLSERLVRGLYVGGALWESVHHVAPPHTLLVGAGAAGCLGLLAWRRRERLTGYAAGVGALALVGRRVAPALNPGAALVLLAFAAIPLGTGIALRRERRREEAARSDHAEPRDDEDVLDLTGAGRPAPGRGRAPPGGEP